MQSEPRNIEYRIANGEGTNSGPAKGLVIAGLGGGSGKSVVAVGLAAAFAGQGKKVVPFKKGPDYIDAGWLQLAASNPCYNLDPYLMEPEVLLRSFFTHSLGAEIVIVEGNRGLYDGVDAAGAYSTAELSLLLNLPVLLVVDCTKTTRTVAALVLGCLHLDPRVRIIGVVLNRIGSGRQEAVIRQAVEQYTGIPVLGALRRMATDVFPQRHLGVTPYQEHEDAGHVREVLAGVATDNLDLNRIEQVMAEALPLEADRADSCRLDVVYAPSPAQVRIGVFKDAAFQFYYPDNLEALQREGAELIEINALTAPGLPELDGLYIGGGFPETSAAALAANYTFRDSVRHQAETGLPIYAECGGLIYLGEAMILDGVKYPLAGIFPVRFGLGKKPQAHGYTVLQVDGNNPFYPRGLEIKGHEFRYSRILSWQGTARDLVFAMQRGVGFDEGRDGLVYKNTLALYTHVHAAATPQWAGALVQKAKSFRASGHS